MVVVEAVPLLASSRENVSRSDIPSQERLERFPMEHGECFSHTKLPEYKRCRVSAVRDFPLGCGPFAQLSSLRPVQEVASYGIPKEEMATALLDRKCISPPDGSTSVSNDNGPEKFPDKMYPRRSVVEAVRDFPPFCGINASLEARTLGQKKSVMGYKASSSNTAKTDVKQTGIGDRVQPNTEKKIHREKPFDISHSPNHLHEENFESSRLTLDKLVVLGLMASSNCPWKEGCKHKSNSGISERKREKFRVERSKPACIAKDESEIGGIFQKKNRPVAVKTAYQGTGRLVMRDEEYSLEDDENKHDHVFPASCHTDGCPPPFGPSSSSSKTHDNTTVRNKVKDTLLLFRDECGKLLLEEEHKRSKGGGISHRRVDLEAYKILKDKKVFVKSGKQIIGAVPGVDVGDKFQYRVELNIIGLHRPTQGGIDYGNFGGKLLATSIVASGGYADDVHNKNSLIYTGQGGNVMNRKDPEDQKLERGNLALKNSVQKNPVRVIRGSNMLNGSRTYVYDGLYLVEKYWQERGPHGKLVFKFQMNRLEDNNLLGN
ncbi:hypothetical protein ABKV19_013955 [Rosa sericea]